MLKKIIKKVYRSSVSVVASVAGWPLIARSLVYLKDAEDNNDVSGKLIANVFKQQKFSRVAPNVQLPLHWKFLPKALGITEQEAPVSGRVMKNAKILGRSGTVINSKNQLVYDASPEICLVPETHSVFNRVVYTKGLVQKGLGLNLSASQSEQNYFHWMTDAIPKLAIAKAMGYDIASFDYFIVNSRAQSYQKETLKVLQIADEKVVALDEHPYVICESVLVTTPTCESGNVSGWIIDFLRSSFIAKATKSSKTGKRILVCRKNAVWRRLLNEAEVIAYLKKTGFEEVYLEEKTVAEQADIFGNAEIVIASHGAGLTNIAFCKPGAHVIELFPPTYVNQGYWTMSSIVGLDYSYIIGSGIEIENNHDLLRNSDFSVSISQLESQLLRIETKN